VDVVLYFSEGPYGVSIPFLWEDGMLFYYVSVWLSGQI